MIKAADQESADVLVLVSYGYGQPVAETIAIPSRNGGSYSGTTFGPDGLSSTHGTFEFGSSSQTKTVMTPTEYLRISAYDSKRFAKTKTVFCYWQVNSIIVDESGDMRAAIPILTVAISNYIGKSSGKVVWVRVADNDPKLLVLKGSKE
jgi:hypothetical protein